MAQNANEKSTGERQAALADSIFERALEYRLEKKRDSALYLFDEAYKKAIAINNDELEAKIYLYKGKTLLEAFGPRDKAIRPLMEGLRLYSELQDTMGLASVQLQLGILSYDMEQYENAINYFTQIIYLLDPQDSEYQTSEYLLALSYSELEDFQRADSMFQCASERYGSQSISQHIQVESFRGKMLINQGKAKEALDYLKAIDVPYENHSIEKDDLIILHCYLSKAYLALQEYESAIYYGRRCYDVAFNKGSAVIYLREAQNNLQLAYDATGRYDSAYYYLNQLKLTKDSMANNEIAKHIAELESQYEYDQEVEKQRAEQAIKDAITEANFQKEKFRQNILLAAIVISLLVARVLFSQRNKIKREKQRSDSLLLNILPEKIAQELKEKGKAEAQQFESVAILFSDFKSFTSKSVQLSARELVEEIDTCFAAFDKIIGDKGIEKIKTIGDAYMAAGGIPVPTKDNVKNTVLAGLDMQAFIARRIAENQAAGKEAFEMRLGIHVGSVIAGIVGTKKFQYDIWGDTVNTAARIESSSVAGKVNISDFTYQLIKDDPDFIFEDRGLIEAKGKGKLHMWFVIRSESYINKFT